MIDLIVTIAHHIVVFALVSILAAELAILRRGFKGERVALLGIVDLSFGIAAALVLAVGFVRVFYGAADPAFYLTNWVFWAKIAAFLVIGLLSLPPTLTIFAWRREALIDPEFTPDAAAIVRVRRFMLAEVAVFPLIPIFAAMMARGIGH